MALHLECVPEPAQCLARQLFPAMAQHRFVLAGGTALALQLGHRVSLDFDFFTAPQSFPARLLDTLAAKGHRLEPIQDRHDTLDVIVDGVKCSFFSYPYPFTGSPESLHGVPLASVLDIAAMKLVAIAQRGARKDFVDLYVVLQNHDFSAVFDNALRRFGASGLNPIHIGKSLAYFADADHDPEPVYRGPAIAWETIRQFFRSRAPTFTRRMIDAAPSG